MNKFIKRFRWIIFPFCATLFSFVVSLYNKEMWFVCPRNSDHYNIISIDALFGGFLYTNYSLLIGILNNPAIIPISNTTVIEKRNDRILRGIAMSLASIVSALYLIFIPDANITSLATKIVHLLYIFIQNAEVVLLICMIIYFALSVVEMNKLIKYMRPKKIQESIVNGLRRDILNSKDSDSEEE